MATATLDSETSHGLVVESIRKDYQEGPLDFDMGLKPEEARDRLIGAAFQNDKGFRVNEFVVGRVGDIVSGRPGATKYAIDFDMGEDAGHLDFAYLDRRFSAAAREGELPAGLYLDRMGIRCRPGKDRLSLVFKYR